RSRAGGPTRSCCRAAPRSRTTPPARTGRARRASAPGETSAVRIRRLGIAVIARGRAVAEERARTEARGGVGDRGAEAGIVEHRGGDVQAGRAELRFERLV